MNQTSKTYPKHIKRCIEPVTTSFLQQYPIDTENTFATGGILKTNISMVFLHNMWIWYTVVIAYQVSRERQQMLESPYRSNSGICHGWIMMNDGLFWQAACGNVVTLRCPCFQMFSRVKNHVACPCPDWMRLSWFLRKAMISGRQRMRNGRNSGTGCWTLSEKQSGIAKFLTYNTQNGEKQSLKYVYIYNRSFKWTWTLKALFVGSTPSFQWGRRVNHRFLLGWSIKLVNSCKFWRMIENRGPQFPPTRIYWRLLKTLPFTSHLLPSRIRYLSIKPYRYHMVCIYV